MTNTARWTRRDFLFFKRRGRGHSRAFVPGTALGLNGASPARETVRVGVIGCGGRSRVISESGRRQGIPGRGGLRL